MVRPEFDVLPLEATAAVAAAAPEEDKAVRLFVDMVVVDSQRCTLRLLTLL